jgi:hypothetical protein
MNDATNSSSIVFGMLSYRSSSHAISQFADAVYPHKVLVHHDFSQTPDFKVDRENVFVVSNPHRTSWGNWSLVEATFILIEQAIAMGQWDYFQLVSESCLPVRPLAEFSAYLDYMKPDVMIDMRPLKSDSPEVMMNYAWRYLPRSALIGRIARRAGIWWIGRDCKHQEGYGGNMKVPSDVRQTQLDKLKRAIGKCVIKLVQARGVSAFPLGEIGQCWVGSQWFALSRVAAHRVVATRSETPELEAHFKRCHIPDESYIHTVISKCSFGRIQPSNHITFWKSGGFGPDELTLSDVPRIDRSKKFFARKFSLNTDCPVRYQVLARLDNGFTSGETTGLGQGTARTMSMFAARSLDRTGGQLRDNS